MKRRMHPFHRAINLFVGFATLFGGLLGAAYLFIVGGVSIWQFFVAGSALILGIAWIYDDLLDPMDDRYPDFAQDKSEIEQQSVDARANIR
ncbi:MAG: hypothetical protein EOP21_03040 [Hyphomicrobiales bacterium]|nr:MAG: hypothetical protein EOP21_03040 [Hyphomicrobiales bacterium]